MPKVKIIEAPPVRLNRSVWWPVAKTYAEARKAAIKKSTEEPGFKVQREVVR